MRKGIKAIFGSSIVADVDSIKSRGADGVLPEMALNNLRKYLIAGVTDVPLSDEIKKVINRNKNMILQAFPMEEGKFIVDPNEDIEKVLISLFNTPTTVWQELYETKVTKTFKEERTEGIEVEYKFDQTGIFRGQVYVIMDAEHIG